MTPEQQDQAAELLAECYAALLGHRPAPRLAERVEEFLAIAAGEEG